MQPRDRHVGLVEAGRDQQGVLGPLLEAYLDRGVRDRDRAGARSGRGGRESHAERAEAGRLDGARAIVSLSEVTTDDDAGDVKGICTGGRTTPEWGVFQSSCFLALLTACRAVR